MQTLVTADLHLNWNPRDSYRHTFMEHLVTIVEKVNPDRLLILGDLTDEKDCHNAYLVNAIMDELSNLAKLVPVIILRGNHDCLDPHTPFFAFVGQVPNIRWINYPTGITLPGLGNCLFLPHTRNHEKDWKDISFAPFKRDPNCGFIFAHNTFDGADAGSGRRLRGIPTNVFPAHSTVISGDVHVPQTLEQVTYVGAPYTINFGDPYEPRLLGIGLTKRGEPQMQDHPLEGIQKRLVELSSIKESRMDRAFGEKCNPHDIVKVKFSLSPEQYLQWPMIQKAVREYCDSHDLQLATIQPLKSKMNIKLNMRTPQQKKSDLELLEHFGKRRNVNADVLKTGKWLMEKV